MSKLIVQVSLEFEVEIETDEVTRFVPQNFPDITTEFVKAGWKAIGGPPVDLLPGAKVKVSAKRGEQWIKTTY